MRRDECNASVPDRRFVPIAGATVVAAETVGRPTVPPALRGCQGGERIRGRAALLKLKLGPTPRSTPPMTGVGSAVWRLLLQFTT